eukprot:310488-Prorocentrum_lima.AAC.1
MSLALLGPEDIGVHFLQETSLAVQASLEQGTREHWDVAERTLTCAHALFDNLRPLVMKQRDLPEEACAETEALQA